MSKIGVRLPYTRYEGILKQHFAGKIGEMVNYQNVNLPKCKLAKMLACQNVNLLRWQLAKMSTCQNVNSPKWQTVQNGRFMFH
jgi:hypothetical protein